MNNKELLESLGYKEPEPKYKVGDEVILEGNDAGRPSTIIKVYFGVGYECGGPDITEMYFLQGNCKPGYYDVSCIRPAESNGKEELNEF